ncbi:hypothetical protein H4R34_004272 [Dimargaris verticillata]|uniref:Protein RER1 n=1 Tax=Dimargaris verticillata TaxID=2761393 RepID=A0A9W8EBV0_9FUNG|nr:hypothetical protein H4R34_004272 [Dimargaris verticillata]
MESAAPSGWDSSNSVATNLQQYRLTVLRRIQTFLDSTISYTPQRWVFTAVALVAFLVRVFMTHRWYIVTYALGIYLLNLFLAFLTPKWETNSALADMDEEDLEGIGSGPSTSNGPGLLPTSSSEEFRPFIRRLPEFKFWLSATRATLIAIVCTFIKALDIPVFWPILLVYFIILFVLTMRRQIAHMVKYRYVPFDLGKQNYRRK